MLRVGNQPVPLGARAMDLLLALIGRPGEFVATRDLLAQVWAGVHVEDSNLRFQVRRLREALAAHAPAITFIASNPGRGYCFIGTVTDPVECASIEPAPEAPPTRMPAVPQNLIGREADIEAVLQRLNRHRAVTLVGPGGNGKTTVAIAAANRFSVSTSRRGVFVDLSLIKDPALVASAVATALGLPVLSSDPLPSIVRHLAGQWDLLVLDNCEHVIEQAAILAEGVLKGAPASCVLATSREPCGFAEEFVHWLPPLAVPPAGHADPLAFPAAQLFLDRSRLRRPDLGLDVRGAELVGEVCRRLDGLPLAIELVATRMGAMGLDGLSVLLREGDVGRHASRRTAMQRHRTLQATFEWSYNLLTSDEAEMLRALSIIAGSFSLEAAQALAAKPLADQPRIVHLLASLTEKSLVVAEHGSGPESYRLLQTTRHYALEALQSAGKLGEIARRYAQFCADLLQRALTSRRAAPNGGTLGDAARQVSNIRSALAWCFGPEGDVSLGIKLAAVAAPLFLDLMLLNECESWAAQAEANGAAEHLAPALLLELRFARGVALRFARADNERTLQALGAALEVAEQLDDAEYQLRLTEGLFVSLYRTGDAERARAYATRAKRNTGAAAVIDAAPPVDWMLGLLDNTMGRYPEARRHLETAIRDLPRQRRPEVLRFGIDQRVFALSYYGQLLWTLGFPDQAIGVVDQTMAEIEKLGHPVILCNAFSWTFPVLLRAGLLDRAQRHAEALAELAPKHFLVPFQSVSQCYLGKLATLRGDFEAGLETMSGGLRALERDRNMVIDFTTRIDFAEALVDAGRHQLALDNACELIHEIERTSVKNFWSEAWRIKGLALAGRSQDDWPEADAAFRTALTISRAQGALSWALRAAADRAAHLARANRVSEALSLTKDALAPFTEGFDTKDLRRAGGLVQVLQDNLALGT